MNRRGDDLGSLNAAPPPRQSPRPSFVTAVGSRSPPRSNAHPCPRIRGKTLGGVRYFFRGEHPAVRGTHSDGRAAARPTANAVRSSQARSTGRRARALGRRGRIPGVISAARIAEGASLGRHPCLPGPLAARRRKMCIGSKAAELVKRAIMLGARAGPQTLACFSLMRSGTGPTVFFFVFFKRPLPPLGRPLPTAGYLRHRAQLALNVYHRNHGRAHGHRSIFWGYNNSAPGPPFPPGPGPPFGPLQATCMPPSSTRWWTPWASTRARAKTSGPPSSRWVYISFCTGTRASFDATPTYVNQRA